ncbi:MAG: fumarylacetoacetate hydrolase family protein [Burkholderiales bacterium]|nr:MAG: fumarylacetoacetate hydrolase family protein [Burkholderiales bacterium]
MKLASFRDGSRDGQLMVVSRDMQSAHFATAIAPTLQRALDDWPFIGPQLGDLYETLNGGKARHAFAFDPSQCMAPLPRAFQWADASAYPTHAERVRRARGGALPEPGGDALLIYQGGSDAFLGPTEDAPFGDEQWGIDFEAELAAVIDDVAMGASARECREHIRLLVLLNDWTLRNLVPDELAKGFGFFQSKPATAFAPVAITPDEIGDGWRGGRAHAALRVHWNGTRVCTAEAGTDMAFDFGELIAHMVRTRHARAGSIVGSGTVSNRDLSRGYACIAEKRALEIIEAGTVSTGFMRFGDTVRIEMFDVIGQSLFGAIEQRVVAAAQQGRNPE